MTARTRDPDRLFEREAELSALHGAVARALAGDGALLVVRGLAGIGKSALLRAAQGFAETHAAIVLRARAAPFERGFPYGVARQLFEPVLARGNPPIGELFAGAAAGAQRVLCDEPTSSVSRDSLFAGLHSLYWLTVNLASRAPVLVCVDDVTWCDEASLRYLEFLVRRLEGMRVAVLVAHRTGAPCPLDPGEGLLLDPLAEVVEPGPLSERAVGRILADGLGEEVDPEFCVVCRRVTGGNPLLLVELLRALEREHVRPRTTEVARVRRIGAVAVAPGVRRRLSFLGHRAQSVAQAAAILGETVRRDDLARTAGVDAVELEESLAALASAGITQSAERVSFVHPLVGDAIRASLSPVETARLHDQAVGALSAREASPWELAPHIVAGAPRAHPAAAELLQAAGDWALAAGAPEAAVTYFSRAMRELSSGKDPAPLLLHLGKAKMHAGHSGAQADLERAIELARDPRTRTLARTALSVALFAAGAATSAIEVLERGIDEIAAVDTELAQDAEAELLATLTMAGPSLANFPPSSRERLTRARTTRRPRPILGDRLVRCSLACEELTGGSAAAEVIACADEGLLNDEVLSAEGPACVPFYLAIAALIFCDELERVASILTRALAASRRVGSITGFVWASVWRAYTNLRRGRLLDAEADARAAIDAGDRYMTGPGLIDANVWLAGSLTEQGRLNEAAAALRLVREPDPPSNITFTLLEGRAAHHLALRDYQAAARELERYHELDARLAPLVTWRKPALGPVNHRSLWARALIGLGDLDRARALVEEEVPLARALGTRRAIGMTRHTAGLLEHGEARIRTLKRATEELAQAQSRLEHARALCDYGATLRRANRRVEARPPLQTALSIAREAHAGPLRDYAADELKATGARVSRPGLTGVDALTASEHRIVTMAAAGMSNRDIAQSLFVTTKTVEMHLWHSYQKLNLSRRSELAAALSNHEMCTEPARHDARADVAVRGHADGGRR